MRIHNFKCYCDVCGEEGMGTLQTAGAMWDRYATVRHSDPAVCADNLARQRRKLERERAEFEAARAYVDGAAWVRKRGETVAYA